VPAIGYISTETPGLAENLGGWGCAGARAGAGCACLRVRACVTCVRDARGVMLSARVWCVGVCYPIRAPMWFIVCYH